MAYTPTNWQDGDIITADKLNHLEQGIAANEQGIEDTTLEFSDPDNDGNIVLSYKQQS